MGGLAIWTYKRDKSEPPYAMGKSFVIRVWCKRGGCGEEPRTKENYKEGNTELAKEGGCGSL